MKVRVRRLAIQAVRQVQSRAAVRHQAQALVRCRLRVRIQAAAEAVVLRCPVVRRAAKVRFRVNQAHRRVPSVRRRANPVQAAIRVVRVRHRQANRAAVAANLQAVAA